MPRYFFHFSDGKRQFADSTGCDLTGLQAARAYATTQVRDLKAAMCAPHIVDLSGWTMTVTDAQGRQVFLLGFDLKPQLQPEPEPPDDEQAMPERSRFS